MVELDTPEVLWSSYTIEKGGERAFLFRAVSLSCGLSHTTRETSAKPEKLDLVVGARRAVAPVGS